MGEREQTGDGARKERVKVFRWGFASASGMVLALVVAGQAVGVMLAGFGVGGMQARDWIFCAFLASACWLCFLQRHAIWRFLRSVQVGVTLVVLTTLAVIGGVLVPQIEGFEDPEQRVTAANYEDQYAAFRWAEGYFLYHVLHPYGIGMPEAVLPPGIDERLEAFGRRYGREEEKNRKKQMSSAFSGGPKTNEIRAFIERHDVGLRRAFDVCTALHLNRTYKSWWFTTLLGLLGASIFSNLWRGKPRRLVRIEKIGFLVTHLGMLVMLVGGGISKSQTVRGILHLDLEQPPNNEFWAYHSPEDRRTMPFWLHLQRFARKDWKQLEVGFVEDRFSSRPPTYTLWEGRTIDLDFVEAGAGGSFSTGLSVGTHTIWASVSDSGKLGGSDSVVVTVVAPNTPRSVTISAPADGSVFDSGGLGGSDSVVVTVASNTPPTVAISEPADGSIFDEGTSIDFAGSASDSQDGDLTTGLVWNSSLDGIIEPGGLRPRVRLEVLGLHERVEVSEWLLSEAGDEHAGEGLGAVLQLSVPDYERLIAARAAGMALEDLPRLTRAEFLSPAYPGQDLFHDLAWDVRIKAVFDGGPSTEFSPADLFPVEEIVGHLELRELEQGDVQARRVPFRVGDTIEAPGGFRIEVKEATGAYRVNREDLTEIRDTRPLAEQPPHSPAVWLSITPPGGGEPEHRLVHERVDAEKHGKLEKYTYDSLVVRLQWERWASAGPPRFVITWSAAGDALLYSEDAPNAAPVPLVPGDPLPVPGRIVLERAFADAFAEKEVLFLEEQAATDGFETDFYSNAPCGLELRVTQDPDTPSERVEVVRLATTEHSLADRWQSSDESFYVTFFENEAVMPYEWRSVLSIFDEDPDGRWSVFSGVDGRLIETRNAQDSHLLSERHGVRIIPLEDIDGDGERDFAGPVKRLDTGPERAREIRVNDYLSHAGYRFFQTNAIPEIPTYSGIGVVFDPGIPMVLAGMYTIILGTVLAFIVRPIVLARRKKRKAGA